MPSVIFHAVVSVAAGVTFVPREGPNQFGLLPSSVQSFPMLTASRFPSVLHTSIFSVTEDSSTRLSSVCYRVSFSSLFSSEVQSYSRGDVFYLLFFFLLTASHGLLDALTNGGLGVSIRQGFFCPWRPIVVSPMRVVPFFSRRGLAVIKSELLWVWLPCFIMAIVSAVIRLLPPRH